MLKVVRPREPEAPLAALTAKVALLTETVAAMSARIELLETHGRLLEALVRVRAQTA